jgi:hypothetical protein
MECFGLLELLGQTDIFSGLGFLPLLFQRDLLERRNFGAVPAGPTLFLPAGRSARGISRPWRLALKLWPMSKSRRAYAARVLTGILVAGGSVVSIRAESPPPVAIEAAEQKSQKPHPSRKERD